MLKYKILIPSGIVFEGEATMVVVPAILGELGILEHHLNYFSLLKAGIVKVFDDDKIIYRYFIEGGMVKIDKDVLIFTEETIDLSKVNRVAIEERFKVATELLLKDPTNEKKLKEREVSGAILDALNAKV